MVRSTMVSGMPTEQPERALSGAALDASAIRQLARLAGLEIDEARAERLLPDLAALIEADQRLKAFDLGDHPASGSPWGRMPDDG